MAKFYNIMQNTCKCESCERGYYINHHYSAIAVLTNNAEGIKALLDYRRIYPNVEFKLVARSSYYGEYIN